MYLEYNESRAAKPRRVTRVPRAAGMKRERTNVYYPVSREKLALVCTAVALSFPLDNPPPLHPHPPPDRLSLRPSVVGKVNFLKTISPERPRRKAEGGCILRVDVIPGRCMYKSRRAEAISARPSTERPTLKMEWS